MPEPESIVHKVIEIPSCKDVFLGKNIDYCWRHPGNIDPVRYIGNRSSGKMGYALAKVAAARGAKVVLVSGPTHLAPPPGVEVILFNPQHKCAKLFLGSYSDSHIVIKAAAVADYRPQVVCDNKIKNSATLTLTLEKNTRYII